MAFPSGQRTNFATEPLPLASGDSPIAAHVDGIVGQLHTRWQNRDQKTLVLAACVIGLGLVSAAALVYATGGTHLAYVHAIYVPVLLAAFFFGVGGGVFVGFVGGILVGPLMPLHVGAGIDQGPINWMARTGAFMVIGAFAGVMSKAVERFLKVVHDQAYFDPVTDLPNRTRLFADLSNQARPIKPSMLQKDAARVSYDILVIKLDQYDAVVQTMGHTYADTLLKLAVTRTQGALGESAALYDLREGVFALLPASRSPAASREIAQALAAALKEPFTIDGIPLMVEPRFGTARFPGDADTPVAVLRTALSALDDARYHKDRFATYDPQSDDHRRQAVGMLGDFRNALKADDQLSLQFQPKLSLGQRRCIGVEGLLRWHHPDRGMVSPGLFVPLAEKTALIEDLTDWVVRTALRRGVAWHADGLDVPIAVNISVSDLERPGFAVWLEGLLNDFDVPVRSLEIEVTESALMTSRRQVQSTLADLREIGLKIALDDFGTGQSSLSYMQDLPVDSIKLDRSLIRDVGANPRTYKLAEGIVGICSSLGYEAVAEGIEDEQTAQRLEGLGCHIGQGYHFGRPMPNDAFRHWLNSADRLGA